MSKAKVYFTIYDNENHEFIETVYGFIQRFSSRASAIADAIAFGLENFSVIGNYDFE